MAEIIDVEELIRTPPFELSECDKLVLRTPEEIFVPHTWNDIKTIIAGGDMSLLRRFPTHLANYIVWTRETRLKVGSVLNFIIEARLHWKMERPQSNPVFLFSSSTPFHDATDYRILRNDWPYATMPGMVHLVVWSKTPVETDEQGYPTSQSRELIKNFLVRVFGPHMDKRQNAGDNIQWFRNPFHCQSVQNIEHIHVILRDADQTFVTALTGQTSDNILANTYSPSKDS
ncbi:hypothetical protein N7462_010793 [Penicillium macrosclerotiorum]|uniref:uncharacterized protein n=1 Tax=Penicillium macrosclerotiorum TaxID=303699 RepID=UPI00254883AB|nr:uncharacterized protein N7462_010793 [Penicillium macrosclerotiorum]KAJ5669723.1 hypothetical protein N7462_010793 [Penicillium macrosclerotiorum]